MSSENQLVEVLLRDSVVTPEQLEEARQVKAKEPGKQLGIILVGLGHISQSTLVSYITRQSQTVADLTRLGALEADSGEAINKPDDGKPRPRIGEILIEQRLIEKSDLEAALAVQKQKGGLLGMILVDRGKISSKQLLSALKHQAEDFF